MINLILCGGSGTRLWPMSRKHFPKQFCPLIGENSLFQKTYLRNKTICEKQIIVTGADHYFMAADQLDRSGAAGDKKNLSFLLEPCGRNTAPAIALACLSVDRSEIIFVTPSDHLIEDESSYIKVAKEAERIAREGFLVTFGIKPAYPETGYGYIERGGSLEKSNSCFHVKSFREKPDLKTAERYVSEKNFFWNSGMFTFSAGVFLDELEKYSPEIYNASVSAFNSAQKQSDDSTGYYSISIVEDAMKKIPSDSIDYAVMEKSSHVSVIPSDFGWNDLGSFDSLYDVMAKDADENTVSSNIININSKRNLFVSGKRKIAAIGLEDCIVIDTSDAILISKRGSSQLVKQAVDLLAKGSESERDLTEFHSTVYRPWGSYTVLEDSGNYKIKRIVVHPGKRLSLQKHIHRSEHWVVVGGTATATVGSETKIVRINESIYIPIGERHRLENTGKIDLVIIETQVGEYVGEDDIIRIEDDFSRA